MGFFSWKTADTDKSIANAYSNRSTFEVALLEKMVISILKVNMTGMVCLVVKMLTNYLQK